MKNLITLLLLLPFSMFAQSPQGLGYQAVATDLNGVELINQTISIQASILSSSATGNIEWQEQHSVTTDEFGLFTLTIGQGISTGTGVQTSFADISWGANTHFLKIEMDVSGGTNYSLIGTNQMMSVPYALYAENTNIDYDSISTLLSNDSTFISTLSGGIGGGCDITYPHGFSSEIVTEFVDDNASIYTVPNGKVFYLMNEYNYFGDVEFTLPNGSFGRIGFSSGKPIILSAGQQIKSSNYAHINGYLVDENPNITCVTEFVDDNASIYTVPNGKVFYLMNEYNYFGDVEFTLPNGSFGRIGFSSGKPIILSAGQQIKSSNYAHINGYLVDENYFADCVGGSSTSTIDSSYIDSLVQFYSSGSGGGCDYKYPQGLHGDPITHDLNNYNDYVVPSGKKLYILQHFGAAQDARIRIDGIPIKAGGNAYAHQYTLANPIIASSGQTIACFSNTQSVFNGIIVEENNDVQSITHDLNNYNDYVVPSGKKLYILQHFGAAQDARIRIDGIPIKAGGNAYAHQYTLANPIIASSGQTIACFSNTQSVFNGYIVDENYFADCGGGGSSSSTVDSSYIDSLVQYYVSNNSIGGCNIDPFFPEGMEGVEYTHINITNSSPYTVPTNKTLYLISNQNNLDLNGNGRVVDDDHFFPIPIDEGKILSLNSGSIDGYLIDKGFEVINYLGGDTIYTIPNDMFFYVLHADNYINDGNSYIGGTTGNPSSGSIARTPLVFQPGSSISSPYGISGLLIPTDHCDQPSSFGSTVDSSYIDSLVQYYSTGNGGGCDFSFPESRNGDAVNILLHQTNGTHSIYTVPTGKRLYINNVYGKLNINTIGTIIEGSNKLVNNGMPPVLQNPIILNSGESIIHYPNEYTTVSGFLVDENPNLQAFSALLHQTNGTHSIYTVPTGKRLYINNVYGKLNINTIGTIIEGSNKLVNHGGPPVLQNPVIINSGESIIHIPNEYTTINGYLVEEDYFADCGGGGGSSSSSSFLDSTTVANMIANSNGSLSFGDIMTVNDTIETQAQHDGFLFGRYEITGSNGGWVNVRCDSISVGAQTRARFEKNSFNYPVDKYGSFMIPVKKDEYFSFDSYSYSTYGNASIFDVYFIPIVSNSNSSNNTSPGPTFVDPILITNTLCGSGNLLIDSIRINIDSILGQNVSSLIIHSDFSGPSIFNTNNSHNINLDVSSYNNVFSTPIFSMSTQLDPLGYATNITDINNQTIIPNSNSGIINLVITGNAISNGSPACSTVNGNIKIVGYY